MPDFPREQVATIADLAHLDLTDAELDELAPQLAAIVGHVASIRELDLDQVEPTSHPLEMVNVLRPDEVQPSLSSAQALAGAPQVEQQQFAVPRVTGEEQ